MCCLATNYQCVIRLKKNQNMKNSNISIPSHHRATIQIQTINSFINIVPLDETSMKKFI